VSPGSRLCTTFLNNANYGEITTEFKFTGTGVQPRRNRTFIQFDYAQHCRYVGGHCTYIKWTW